MIFDAVKAEYEADLANAKPTRSSATVSQIVPNPWGKGTFAAFLRELTDFCDTMLHHTSTTDSGTCFIRFNDPTSRRQFGPKRVSRAKIFSGASSIKGSGFLSDIGRYVRCLFEV